MLFRSGLLEFFSSLGLVSKFVLLVLVVFSIGSWTVILYKWRFFRRQEAADLRFLKTYRRYEHPLDASRELHLHRDSSVAAVFSDVARCYRLGGNGNPRARLAMEGGGDGEAGLPTQRYVEQVLAHAMQEQITRTEAELPFLATTGNVTPFIGLLGAVLGIIDAFREIGVQGTASIAAVAPGVALALGATAAGLFAAIPAVIAYNYYLTRIRRTAFRVESFSLEFLNSLDSWVKQVGVRA